MGKQLVNFITLDSQSHVIKFTSNCCLPMVGGSLRHLPPLKLVAMAAILLKVALNTKNQNQMY
jgi:hypothetical protein